MVFKGYIPFMGFPRGSVGEESTSNVGDPGWILGGEDPLEKEMAAHSSILAWRIPRTEEPGGPQFMGSQRIGQDQASKHTQFIVIMSYWLYCLCESESHSTVHEILQARTLEWVAISSSRGSSQPIHDIAKNLSWPFPTPMERFTKIDPPASL